MTGTDPEASDTAVSRRLRRCLDRVRGVVAEAAEVDDLGQAAQLRGPRDVRGDRAVAGLEVGAAERVNEVDGDVGVGERTLGVRLAGEICSHPPNTADVAGSPRNRGDLVDARQLADERLPDHP